jgi:hypothetical protein
VHYTPQQYPLFAAMAGNDALISGRVVAWAADPDRDAGRMVPVVVSDRLGAVALWPSLIGCTQPTYAYDTESETTATGEAWVNRCR